MLKQKIKRYLDTLIPVQKGRSNKRNEHNSDDLALLEEFPNGDERGCERLPLRFHNTVKTDFGDKGVCILASH